MQFPNRRVMLQRVGAATLYVSPLLTTTVFANTFIDIAQVQKILLPQADSFYEIPFSLDDTNLRDISKTTQLPIPKNFNPKIWRADKSNKTLGWVITDRVIGKFDLIDYAAGFLADGTSVGLEITAYRESHGYQIKQPAWRKQFADKKGPLAMRFADDIRNISGATLSCQHVTEGMQRLSALATLLVAGK